MRYASLDAAKGLCRFNIIGVNFDADASSEKLYADEKHVLTFFLCQNPFGTLEYAALHPHPVSLFQAGIDIDLLTPCEYDL
jgi:hypothetical protein